MALDQHKLRKLSLCFAEIADLGSVGTFVLSRAFQRFARPQRPPITVHRYPPPNFR